MTTNSRLILIAAIIFSICLAGTIARGQEKTKPDTTTQRVAVKELIVELEGQRKQVIDEANQRVTQITAQIQLLQYLKSDSVAVPKKQ
jgi:uncharacterized membrane protein